MLSPNPTLFRTREASEPYSRGQWDSALKATPRSPEGDVSYVGALEQTVRSGAHGFRSRRPRSLLRVLNICRIRVNALFKSEIPGVEALRGRNLSDQNVPLRQRTVERPEPEQDTFSRREPLLQPEVPGALQSQIADHVAA